MNKEKHLKAGKALSEAFKLAKRILKPGASLLECAEKIEEEIKKHAELAFPANLSLNENAAHETPAWNSKKILEEKDLLKVDLGAHIDGYIADAAISITFNSEYGGIISAAEQALKEALKIASSATIAEIGKKIEETAKSFGLKPIENLTGHGLERFVVHAKPSIPNIENKINVKLEENRAYAIEPFVTTGSGKVKEANKAEIFGLEREKARSVEARKIINYVKENCKTGIFAERWLHRDLNMSEFQIKRGLLELMRNSSIKAYPPLHDSFGSVVAQAENSFIKEKEGIVLLVDR